MASVFLCEQRSGEKERKRRYERMEEEVEKPMTVSLTLDVLKSFRGEIFETMFNPISFQRFFRKTVSETSFISVT